MAEPADRGKDALSRANRAFSGAVKGTTGKIGSYIGNTLLPGIGGFIGNKVGRLTGEGLQRLLKGLAAVVLGYGLYTIVMIVVGAIVIIFTTSFIMFVINSGGYVVPQGSSLSGGPGTPSDWEVIDVGASCPIPGGVILTGSYDSPFGSTQHGTNEYWDSLGGSCTEYSLPGFTGGQCLARQVGDYCFDQYKGCADYGLAADFTYPDYDAGGKPVFLPYIEGDSVTWRVDNQWVGETSGQGSGFLSTVHNGVAYTMYVTHLAANGGRPFFNGSATSGQSGDVFATLYEGDTLRFTPHLHVELRIDGEFVPPDFMCLAGEGGTSVDVVDAVGCFEFSGPWPEEALENEMAAAEIIMEETEYADRLCSAGKINVIYEPENKCQQGICYGGERSGDDLLIYPAGTGTVAESLFTLAHESAHILQDKTPVDDRMLQDPGVITELPPYSDPFAPPNLLAKGICTYPIPGSGRDGLQIPFVENFAEAIALYIAGPNPQSSYRDFSCLGAGFQSTYPNTYRYIRDNMFQ